MTSIKILVQQPKFELSASWKQARIVTAWVKSIGWNLNVKYIRGFKNSNKYNLILNLSSKL
jgi:hypothetical protein